MVVWLRDVLEHLQCMVTTMRGVSWRLNDRAGAVVLSVALLEFGYPDKARLYRPCCEAIPRQLNTGQQCDCTVVRCSDIGTSRFHYLPEYC
jgi:hypothetical protein